MQGGGPRIELLSIRLLGPPEVSAEGCALRFGRKKALALLCYLVAEGRKRSRGELAELLWPKSDERRARTDLRSILTRLRKTLGEDGVRGDARGDGSSEGVRLLTIDGDLLGVEPRGVELDLRTLEAAVSLTRSETSGSSPGGRSVDDATGRRDLIAHLKGALEVYRGEFMEGFSLEDAPEFELWLEAERARWRALFGELCEGVSRLQAGAGRLEEVIGTTRMWMRHAWLEEAAHRRLVELLSAAGDSEGALLAYENFRSALRRELGTEPSPRLMELAERLREEVAERASLGTNLAHSAATTPLSALEVSFAGRQEEFGALVSEYHACLSGEEPRIFAVVGEAGIGKTRLAKEFLGWARAQGADVLEGEASEGAGLPYGPLIEAIRPRIERERAPDDLLEDTWLSELSRLLPELKERYPDLPSPASGDGGTAKGVLFEAITRTVGALASRAPVVLFLDDLQWADATTLEVLEYAGRRWAEQGAPILVLVAARPEELGAGSSFERWLPSLGRRLPVRSLSLGPLKNEDVEGLMRLLGRAGSEPAGVPEELEEESEGSDQALSNLQRFGEWIAVETGGQPFYLVETLKALLEEGKLVVQAHPDGGVVLVISPPLRVESDLSSLLPHSVREVIHSRLSRLSPAASELLLAGAVLGRGFGFESLVGVASLGETEGLRGLDELLGRRLLLEEVGEQEEEGSPLHRDAAYSFSHERIRQVSYTEGGQARRQVLHRRAFGVLERRGAPAAELARHALAAGLARPSFTYSVAAGDAAAEVFAVRDVIVHYERARDMLDAGPRAGGIEPSIADLEHLYIQMARAYEMAGDWEKARVAYEALLAFARGVGEERLEVVALNHLAVFLFHQENDPRNVTALLEKARRVAEEAGLAEVLAETECNLVDVTVLRTGDFVRSRLLAEKALASARVMERQDLVARVVTTLARLEYAHGRLEVASAYAGEGAKLSRELADRPSAARTGHPSMVVGVMGLSASWRAGNKALQIQCLTYLALVRAYQGRVEEGMTIAREARAISKALPERMETMSLYALGVGFQGAGEYEEALALARRGTERAREVRDTFLLASNLVRLGEAHEVLQNLEEARAAYEEAVDLGHYEAYSYARFCVLAVLSEDWQVAHNHARRAHEVGMFFHPMFSIHLHCEVEALLRAGDEGLAREEARRFAERAWANERDRMSYLRSLAVLSEWEGDTKKAIDHLHEAEALAERLGPPGELWQIRAKIGELHERLGEVGEVREAFSRASQTLRALAAKIKDEGLRESFLSAPRVRRVLGYH
jgi:DNA-binding SARP family transcriptional activator/tetratricopeptide (TPR) repeat protein